MGEEDTNWGRRRNGDTKKQFGVVKVERVVKMERGDVDGSVRVVEWESFG